MPSRRRPAAQRGISARFHYPRRGRINRPEMQLPAQEHDADLPRPAFPRFVHHLGRTPIHPPAAGVIQTKLPINEPGDSYEQDADRIAEHVMRMPESQLHRACSCGGGCPNCANRAAGPGACELTDQADPSRRHGTGCHTAHRSRSIALTRSTARSGHSRLYGAALRLRFFQSTGAFRRGCPAIGARHERQCLHRAEQHCVRGRPVRAGTRQGRQLIAHELAHVVLRWCLANGPHVVQPMTLMSTGLYNDPAGAWLPSIVF